MCQHRLGFGIKSEAVGVERPSVRQNMLNYNTNRMRERLSSLHVPPAPLALGLNRKIDGAAR